MLNPPFWGGCPEYAPAPPPVSSNNALIEASSRSSSRSVSVLVLLESATVSVLVILEAGSGSAALKPLAKAVDVTILAVLYVCVAVISTLPVSGFSSLFKIGSTTMSAKNIYSGEVIPVIGVNTNDIAATPTKNLVTRINLLNLAKRCLFSSSSS